MNFRPQNRNDPRHIDLSPNCDNLQQKVYEFGFGVLGFRGYPTSKLNLNWLKFPQSAALENYVSCNIPIYRISVSPLPREMRHGRRFFNLPRLAHPFRTP